MAANGGIVLVNTSLVAAGSNVTTAVQFEGCDGVLVVAAQQLAPVVNLVLVGVGNQNRTVKVNSGALVAEGVYSLKIPAGSYAVHSATGSSIGLFMALMPTL